jgi:hypothetical protein
LRRDPSLVLSLPPLNFWERVLEGDICLWWEGPPNNWADAGGRARCPGRRKLALNLSRGWVEPDASVWMRRTAGACAATSRIRSNVRGRDASVHWRYPNYI